MLKRPSRQPADKASATEGKGGRDDQPADPAMTSAIGRALRAMFDGVTAEPVPDKFQKLLEELERKAGKG